MKSTRPTVRLSHLIYKNKRRVAIHFDYDKQLIESVKSIPNAEWSKTDKCWHMPNNPDQLKHLFASLKGKATIDGSDFFGKKPAQPAGSRGENKKKTIDKKLTEEQAKAVDWFGKWMQSSGYSENTINTYCSLLEVFFTFIGHKPVRDVVNNDVIDFNSDWIIKTGRSESYQRQAVNAIKLFYGQINGHKLKVEKLERVKKARQLPEVLSLEEVKRLIGSYKNIKHKTMIALTYSCGMRRSEILNLKWKDIDRSRMILNVRLGKGNKDRPVVLPQAMLKLLEEYYKNHKPKAKEYVFEGQNGGQYTGESFLKVLKSGLRKAKIKKKATLHTLRHSYATHLHEQGTDILIIQKLLGHKSMKTTEIYTHISKKTLHGVKNPFENMKI